MNGLNLRNIELPLHPVDISRGMQYWPGYIRYDQKEIKNNKRK